MPATAADAQPALAAPAATPAVEVQPAAEIQPAAPAAEAVQTASAEPKTAPLSMVEVILFCVVVVGVIALGIWKSRDPEETEEEKKAKGASDDLGRPRSDLVAGGFLPDCRQHFHGTVCGDVR